MIILIYNLIEMSIILYLNHFIDKYLEKINYVMG